MCVWERGRKLEREAKLRQGLHQRLRQGLRKGLRKGLRQGCARGYPRPYKIGTAFYRDLGTANVCERERECVCETEKCVCERESV